MRADAGVHRFKQLLPHTFPLYEPGGVYETARLRDWFAARAHELARRFDERNGNDYFTRELADIEALKRSVAPPA